MMGQGLAEACKIMMATELTLGATKPDPRNRPAHPRFKQEGHLTNCLTTGVQRE